MLRSLASMKGFPQIKQLKIPGGGDTAYILLPLLSILSTPTFLFKFTLSSVQIVSMRGQEGLPPSGIFTKDMKVKPPLCS